MEDMPINNADFARLISRSEQADKGYCDIVVQSYASMFRAFCAQEGVTREEALALTSCIISSRESVTQAALMQARLRGAT